MTIPGDVRDVIMEALSALLGRQDFEGEPSERTVNAMNWLDAQPDAPFAPRVLESADDYRIALAYIESLMDAQTGTEEAEALALWGLLVSDYEDRHYPMTPSERYEPVTENSIACACGDRECSTSLEFWEGNIIALCYTGKSDYDGGEVRRVTSDIVLPADVCVCRRVDGVTL